MKRFGRGERASFRARRWADALDICPLFAYDGLYLRELCVHFRGQRLNTIPPAPEHDDLAISALLAKRSGEFNRPGLHRSPDTTRDQLVLAALWHEMGKKGIGANDRLARLEGVSKINDWDHIRKTGHFAVRLLRDGRKPQGQWRDRLFDLMRYVPLAFLFPDDAWESSVDKVRASFHTWLTTVSCDTKALILTEFDIARLRHMTLK